MASLAGHVTLGRGLRVGRCVAAVLQILEDIVVAGRAEFGQILWGLCLHRSAADQDHCCENVQTFSKHIRNPSQTLVQTDWLGSRSAQTDLQSNQRTSRKGPT